MKARYITTKERGFPHKKCPHCNSTTWHIIVERGGAKSNLLYCGDCFFFIEEIKNKIGIKK